MINVTAVPQVKQDLVDEQLRLLREELAVVKGIKPMTEVLHMTQEGKLTYTGGQAKEAPQSKGEAKNKKPGKADPTKKYKRADKFNAWGTVPKQQADLADLLTRAMEPYVEYTEAEVFSFLIDRCGEYESLYKSAQDVTYLFRYYRGLKNDSKRAGFISRDFLRMY
jgi:hypothetical protein